MVINLKGFCRVRGWGLLTCLFYAWPFERSIESRVSLAVCRERDALTDRYVSTTIPGSDNFRIIQKKE
jgi:hypothetical protein